MWWARAADSVPLAFSQETNAHVLIGPTSAQPPILHEFGLSRQADVRVRTLPEAGLRRKATIANPNGRAVTALLVVGSQSNCSTFARFVMATVRQRRPVGVAERFVICLQRQRWPVQQQFGDAVLTPL